MCSHPVEARPANASLRRIISSESSFERDIGYARALVDGNWIFVSGTTGFDYATMTIAPGLVAQCEQALANIATALETADASFSDVVRVRYILPDRADFEPCWPALRAFFGDVRPAATMIVAGLADPRMKIEIEVTARKVNGGRGPGALAQAIAGMKAEAREAGLTDSDVDAELATHNEAGRKRPDSD